MRILKSREKFKFEFSQFWLLIIIGLNFGQIEGHYGKRFTHKNPVIERCIRKYPDASANVETETTMGILQNIFHGVSLGIFSRETWEKLAQFYGPESQWRRAEMSLLYCQKVEKQDNGDLGECLDTIFRNGDSHSAKLKNTPNYGNSVNLFESLILEKELALALQLGRLLQADKIDLEMLFDILLTRSKWELHRIVEHFENEFGDKFGKKNPKNCSLSSHLSARARNDPVNEFAYKMLAKLVKQVHKEIVNEEQIAEKDINEVAKNLAQFCGNFDEFLQAENPKERRKNEYKKMAKELDKMMEKIDFQSPLAFKFGEFFEELECNSFFNYKDETMELPSGLQNYIKTFPISFSAGGKELADNERKRQMEIRKIQETILLRKKMLIMSGMAGNKKYIEKQVERWKSMNLGAKYEAISLFLTVHLGQDLRKILEHFDKKEEFKNPVNAIEQQFGRGTYTKMLYGAAYPKFDAYISLLMVVYGLKGEEYMDIVQRRREGNDLGQLFDKKCYGESEREYREEAELRRMAYEQLKFRKLEMLALKMFGQISAMKRLTEKKIEQIFEENKACKKMDENLGKTFLQTNLYTISKYKLDYGELLEEYLNAKTPPIVKAEGQEEDNFSIRQICLWRMIEEERRNFCEKLRGHRKGIEERKSKNVEGKRGKYANLTKEEKWKREMAIKLKTRFDNHLLGEMWTMEQNCGNLKKLIFLEEETEKKYLHELEKGAHSTAAAAMIGRERNIVGEESSHFSMPSQSQMTEIVQEIEENDKKEVEAQLSSGTKSSSSISAVQIVEPAKKTRKLWAIIPKRKSSKKIKEESGSGGGGYLNLKMPNISFLKRNKSTKSREISTIPKHQEEIISRGIGETSGDRIETHAMETRIETEIMSHSDSGKEKKIEKMSSIISSGDEFEIEKGGKLISTNASGSRKSGVIKIEEIKKASSESSESSEEEEEEKLERKKKTEIVEVHLESMDPDSPKEGDLVATLRNKGLKVLHQAKISSVPPLPGPSPVSEIISPAGIRNQTAPSHLENIKVERAESSSSSESGSNENETKAKSSFVVVDAEKSKIAESSAAGTSSPKRAPTEGERFETAIDVEIGNSNEQKTSHSHHKPNIQHIEAIMENESIGKEGHLHGSSSSQPNIVPPLPISTKPTLPKKVPPPASAAEPSPPSMLNQLMDKASSMLFGGGSSQTTKELVKKDKEIEGKMDISKQQIKAPNSNVKRTFNFEYLNDKYFVNGKMPIQEYTQKIYLDKIGYDPKMAAKCFQICEEFEQNLLNELANIKTQKSVAASKQFKRNMGPNKEELKGNVDPKEIEQINKVLEKLNIKERALERTHNYCSNGLKQKHTEKIFLWINWLADALLQFLIVSGHYRNINGQFDKQIEREECRNWMNDLKRRPTGHLMEKMKEAFEWRMNCRPEMEELWEEKDAFCEWGKKSQFWSWIEANYAGDERNGRHWMLARKCALIDMSSLSMHWCPQHQNYEMKNAEGAMSRQIFILNLRQAMKGIEKEGNYKKENPQENLEELKRKCESFMAKVTVLKNPSQFKKDIQKLIANSNADLPVILCFELLFKRYGEEMNKICENAEKLQFYERKAGNLLKMGREQNEQMLAISKNCDVFMGRKTQQHKEIHGQRQAEIYDQGQRSQMGYPREIRQHQNRYRDMELPPEVIQRIRSQSHQEVPSLPLYALPATEIYHPSSNPLSPTKRGQKDVVFIDKNKVPKDTHILHRITTQQVKYVLFDKDYKKIPLSKEQKKSLKEFYHQDERVLRLESIAEEDEGGRMTNTHPSSSSSSVGHLEQIHHQTPSHSKIPLNLPSMPGMVDKEKVHAQPRESEIPIHAATDILHHSKDKSPATSHVESKSHGIELGEAMMKKETTIGGHNENIETGNREKKVRFNEIETGSRPSSPRAKVASPKEGNGLGKELRIKIPSSPREGENWNESPSKRGMGGGHHLPPLADPESKSPRHRTIVKRSAGFGEGNEEGEMEGLEGVDDEEMDKNGLNEEKHGGNGDYEKDGIEVEMDGIKEGNGKGGINLEGENAFKMELIQRGINKGKAGEKSASKCFEVEKCIGMEFWVDWTDEGDKFWWCQSANNGNAAELVRNIDELIEHIDCLKYEEICPNNEKKMPSEQKIEVFYRGAMKTMGGMEELEMEKESILGVKNDECLDELMEKLAKRQRKICGRFMQETGSDNNGNGQRIVAPDMIRRAVFLEICQNVKA